MRIYISRSNISNVIDYFLAPQTIPMEQSWTTVLNHFRDPQNAPFFVGDPGL